MKHDFIDYKPQWRWVGRNLDNYKAMQSEVAKARGVSAQLAATKTLTAARKAVYGNKRGQLK